MKSFAWLAAAIVGSGLLAATPSSAQVQFGIGPNGPNIRIGPDDDRYERRRVIQRRVVRRGIADRDYVTTGSTRRCRTVTVRDEDRYGDVVVRRHRRCD